MKEQKKLINYLKKIADLQYISSILYWEMDTTAPSKSLDYLITVKTDIEMQAFKLSTSSKYLSLLKDTINSPYFSTISEEEQIYLKDLVENYEREKRIPPKLYALYEESCSKGTIAWNKAREKSDYNIFKPYLTKIISLTKEIYKHMYPDSNNLYDSMLNTYEKGLTSATIDPLFKELKEGILPIIKQLPKHNLKPLNTEYSNDTLYQVGYYLLDYIGFSKERGKLGIYPHGYTTKLNDNDVRITFSNSKPIYDHVSTIIHEGGHGIFEQNVGPNLTKYPGYNIDKYALHESQSRFYENILGRNINFWIPIYDTIKDILSLDLTLPEFMSYLNNAHPSLVRTEADELTYCLHIIMRYEIERRLFSDTLSVDDLESEWNRLTKEYFNLDVPNPNLGILQDVHWAQGNFGYFPSYLLGSIFDGMLLETINKEIGNTNTLLKDGQIKKITKFLNENVQRYGGSYNINEVAKRVCNQPLNVKPLINYFQKKYSRQD